MHPGRVGPANNLRETRNAFPTAICPAGPCSGLPPVDPGNKAKDAEACNDLSGVTVGLLLRTLDECSLSQQRKLERTLTQAVLY